MKEPLLSKWYQEPLLANPS